MVSAVVLANCSEDTELARLQIRRWQGDKTVRSATVILCLHGIESHGGWFDKFAADTAAAGVDCLCYDRVGNGLNLKSSVDSLEQMLLDLKTLTEHLQRQYAHVVVLGMSWGGLLAAYALAQGAISPRYSILLAPGIFSHKWLPFADLLKTLSCLIFASSANIPIPIAVEDFSQQESIRTIIKNDPLRRSQAPAHLLFATQKMRVKVRGEKLPADQVEAWLGEYDQIINNAPLQRYLEKQGVHIQMFKDHGHALIFECPEKLSRMLLERVRSLGLQ